MEDDMAAADGVGGAASVSGVVAAELNIGEREAREDDLTGLGDFFWAGLIWWKAREPSLEPEFYVIICSKPSLSSARISSSLRLGSIPPLYTELQATLGGGSRL
jgi:hypothetical protein